MKHRLWHGLCAALAVGLATKLFGIVGCVVVASAMAILWRWPKPQIITAGVLAVICFVGIVLLQDYRPTPSVATPISQESPRPWDQQYATSRSTVASGVMDPAAEKARWDADARAFTAAHPDLNFGDNLRVMDGYTKIVANRHDRNYSNASILNIAYAAARLDPHWSYFEIADKSADPQR